MYNMWRRVCVVTKLSEGDILTSFLGHFSLNGVNFQENFLKFQIIGILYILASSCSSVIKCHNCRHWSCQESLMGKIFMLPYSFSCALCVLWVSHTMSLSPSHSTYSTLFHHQLRNQSTTSVM